MGQSFSPAFLDRVLEAYQEGTRPRDAELADQFNCMPYLIRDARHELVRQGRLAVEHPREDEDEANDPPAPSVQEIKALCRDIQEGWPVWRLEKKLPPIYANPFLEGREASFLEDINTASSFRLMRD